MAPRTTTRRAQQRVSPLGAPELFLGLVAPIGTDLSSVTEVLQQLLGELQYTSREIRVSALLRDFDPPLQLTEHPLEERYRSYMQAGNLVRKRTRHPDALARLSIAAIRRARRSVHGNPMRPLPRTAFILNQLKRPEEVTLLRQVYGPSFIQISAFAPELARLESLTTRIADSHYGETSRDACRSRAQDLISIDSEEENDPDGQRVRQAFPLADLIIDAGSRETIVESLTRFLHAFFGHPFISPRHDEFFMFLARSAALRSADLSRQVGAALVSSNNELLTLGYNEVPKAGGSVYTEDDLHDYRDHVLGHDTNYLFKKRIVADLIRIMNPWLEPNIAKQPIESLLTTALSKEENPHIEDSMLMDVLEFGRIVHAEMHAITNAARGLYSLLGSTLYCTTFPCHICARHIISSGIVRVVYIEPYSKSVAPQLYPDSIIFEGRSQRPSAAVRFETFVGIAPARFAELFQRAKRKDDAGNASRWRKEESRPLVDPFFPFYLPLEALVTDSLDGILRNAGLSLAVG
jgi:deoxycytidylate deaminase